MNEDLLEKLRARERVRLNALTPEERAREDAESSVYRAWQASERGKLFLELEEVLMRVVQRQVFPYSIQSHRVSVPDDLLESALSDLSRRERQVRHKDAGAPQEALPSLESLKQIIAWFEGDRSLPMSDGASQVLSRTLIHRCGLCGELLTLSFGGAGMWSVPSECSVGCGPLVVRLPVLSGVLAIGNDFRDFAPIDWTGVTSENLMNNRKAVAFTAGHGVVFSQLHEDHGHIRRQADGSFLVGGDIPGEPVPELRDLGGYWRSFADGDLIPQDTTRVYRVPVPPGVYAFTFHDLDPDWDNEAIFPEGMAAPYITIRQVKE